MIAINENTKQLAALQVDDDGNLKAAISGVDINVDNIDIDLTSTNDLLTALTAELVANRGLDSVGSALPADFDTLPETYGYTGTDLTTIVKTKGANTYTQTLAYTAHVLQSASRWVKA